MLAQGFEYFPQEKPVVESQEEFRTKEYATQMGIGISTTALPQHELPSGLEGYSEESSRESDSNQAYTDSLDAVAFDSYLTALHGFNSGTTIYTSDASEDAGELDTHQTVGCLAEAAKAVPLMNLFQANAELLEEVRERWIAHREFLEITAAKNRCMSAAGFESYDEDEVVEQIYARVGPIVDEFHTTGELSPDSLTALKQLQAFEQDLALTDLACDEEVDASKRRRALLVRLLEEELDAAGVILEGAS